MRIRRILLLVFLAVTVMVVGVTPASALPTLQLYIEGSTYDPVSATWTFQGAEFRLWVIGDVSQSHDATIHDVFLTAAFASGLTGTITVTPTTATPGVLPDPGDPSTPSTPVMLTEALSATSPSGSCTTSSNMDGTIPCLSTGKIVPKHGEFGDGVQWKIWALGDLDKTDSPLGDFTTQFPTQFPRMGQINAYDIFVSGLPTGTVIHFDAFNSVQSGTQMRAVFAPFSHDAETTTVPEPGMLVLVTSGLVAVRLFAWRRPRS